MASAAADIALCASDHFLKPFALLSAREMRI
jgi:hypothetical protein